MITDDHEDGDDTNISYFQTQQQYRKWRRKQDTLIAFVDVASLYMF